jgi:hypothetical protein
MSSHAHVIDLTSYRQEKESQENSFPLAPKADFSASCVQEETLLAEGLARIARLPRCSSELQQLLTNLSALD